MRTPVRRSCRGAGAGPGHRFGVRRLPYRFRTRNAIPARPSSRPRFSLRRCAAYSRCLSPWVVSDWVSLLLLLHVRKWEAGILGRFHHFLDLNALVVEWKPVGQSCFRIVETQRDFVDFVAAIACGLLDPVTDSLHFFGSHGLVTASDLHVLSQHFEFVHSG